MVGMQVRRQNTSSKSVHHENARSYQSVIDPEASLVMILSSWSIRRPLRLVLVYVSGYTDSDWDYYNPGPLYRLAAKRELKRDPKMPLG